MLAIGTVESWESYETVYIGFPIWYGCAPNVVNTSCKEYEYRIKGKQMDSVIVKRNELVSQRVIKMLQSRHHEAYYAADKDSALQIALSLIPEGCTVSWGGGRSLQEIGLTDAVRAGNYHLIDRDRAETREERKKAEHQALSADVFLMGTNAITEDGQLVNLDGIGNRVAALCYGPESVIVIAGINKLAPDLEAAVSRVRHTAAPINAQRFPGNTPCRQYGVCGDCHNDDSICSQLVVTRNSMVPGRIKVILVGEPLGF